MLASLLMSRVGLKDIFSRYFSSLLQERFGMIRMPVPDSLLLDGDIFIRYLHMSFSLVVAQM